MNGSTNLPASYLKVFQVSLFMERHMSFSLPESEADRLNWRKSAYSVNNGNCTEVASTAGIVAVRDSQDPDTLVLCYPANSWSSFLNSVRAGHFGSIG